MGFKPPQGSAASSLSKAPHLSTETVAQAARPTQIRLGRTRPLKVAPLASRLTRSPKVVPRATQSTHSPIVPRGCAPRLCPEVMSKGCVSNLCPEACPGAVPRGVQFPQNNCHALDFCRTANRPLTRRLHSPGVATAHGITMESLPKNHIGCESRSSEVGRQVRCCSRLPPAPSRRRTAMEKLRMEWQRRSSCRERGPRYDWVVVGIVSSTEDETSAPTVNCGVDRRGDFVTPCTVPLCCNALAGLISSAFWQRPHTLLCTKQEQQKKAVRRAKIK